MESEHTVHSGMRCSDGDSLLTSYTRISLVELPGLDFWFSDSLPGTLTTEASC